jgi:hypothetical protein
MHDNHYSMHNNKNASCKPHHPSQQDTPMCYRPLFDDVSPVIEIRLKLVSKTLIERLSKCSHNTKITVKFEIERFEKKSSHCAGKAIVHVLKQHSCD